MVSKNNRIKKMEDAADRRQHFAIRKLTVGAASVLLGTTLWLGTNASTAHADAADGNAEPEAHEASDTQATNNTGTAEKVIVEQTKTDDNIVASDNSTSSVSKNSAIEQSNLDESNDKAVSNDKTNNETAKIKNDTNKIAATADTSKLEQNKVDASTVQSNNNTKSQNSVKDTHEENSTVENVQADKVEQTVKNAEKIDNSAVVSETTGVNDINNSDLNKTAVVSDAGKLGKSADEKQTVNFNLDAAALQGLSKEGSTNLATLFNTSLVAKNQSAVRPDITTNPKNDIDDKDFATAGSWNDIQQAASGGKKGVKLTKDISVNDSIFGSFLGNLNINSPFTIEGTKDNGEGTYSLSLGQNSIVNNGNLTLDNITVNGSITGNGTVNIAGTVTSKVDFSNNKTLTKDQINQQVGSKHPGATVDNWKAANIQASKVNVEQGATLNINRSLTGDGIAAPDHGSVNVGINAKLNINLRDAKTANRFNEQSSDINNANTGVRILDNGTFTSGDSAEININAGHGRAVVIDEPFGGTSPVANNTSLEGWENGRGGDQSRRAANHRTSVVLGDSTKMNITGRGGLVLGDTATFVTGDHSIIHIDNQGNGEGLLLDANSRVEVSPHSQLLMTSDGKNASGYFGGGNYIGMGQSAQFRVEHDATFRYKVTNSANNERRPYADNFNIISQAANTHPEVYVGPNATFDGQSDYDDYYGEIFAFSLTSGANTSTVFQIDGAKYVNWEKNNQVLGHSGAGNLYYSMGPGLIDATGQKYYVFKWNNKNLNDNNYTFDDSSENAIAQSINNFKNSSDKYWEDIEHLATKYSKSGNTAEWPGHVVSGNDIKSGSGYNPLDKKTGTPIGNYNSGDGDARHTTGFDPLNSQRLVLVASIIPKQEDKTEQVVDPYDVQVKYVDSLAPGKVLLHQKGENGLKRTTETTYYNVDPSTGEQTIDTTKGTNGHSSTTTVLNKKQDEIIYIGKQTATIGYFHKDGNTETAVDSIGDNGVVTVSGSPVQTDADGNVQFDDNGNVVAADIDYKNYATDLENAEGNGYTNVVTDEWKDSDKKYNVVGLTKEAIQKAAEAAGLNNATSLGRTTVNNQNPNFKIVLSKPEAEKGSVTVKYIDDTTDKTLETKDLSGEVGEHDDYSTAPTIKNYTDNGYKLVSDNYPKSGVTFTKEPQNYEVHLEHTYSPVTPDDPDGVDPNKVTKDVKETIKYVYSDGKQAAPDNVQNATWTRHLTKDKVTGELVPNGKYDTPWTPSKPDYDEVKSPTIDGYTPNKETVPSTPVTQDDINVTVTYTKNAEDQTVTVKYFDDTPVNEGKQDLSGYDKSITAKPGTALDYSTKPTIKTLENKGYELVSDNFNVTAMPENGGNYEVHLKHKHTTITPDKPGKPGEPINPNDPDGPKWPEGTNAQSLRKPGSQTVHYQYIDGSKAADDKVQNVEFDHTLVFDNVTGKQIEDKGWNPASHKFNDVTSPTINGYHPDKTTVAGATVTPKDPTSETTVVYTKNSEDLRDQKTLPSHQTVKFVDENGKEIHEAAKSPVFNYEYSGDTYDKQTDKLINKGSWNADSHKFDTVDVPVISGYYAVSGYTKTNDGKVVAGGLTSTRDNLDVTATVVYHKLGKIVPVTPDHKPIPDAPTPQYPNDPTDPTKVTPNEPVPEIPGKTPEVPTVTPTDPGKDTPVVYNTPDQKQQADLTIVDQDNNNKQIVVDGVTTKFTDEGVEGDAISFAGTNKSVQELENMGYVYVGTDLDGDKFDGDAENVQHFTITMKHGHQPVNPQDPGKPGEPINPNDPEGPKYPEDSDKVTKTVTRTVHYEGAGASTPNDVDQTVNFTASGILDKVTGEWITPLKWSESQNVAGVKTPVVNGYHVVSVDKDADGNNVKGVTLTHEDDDYTVTVKYEPNGKIIPVDPSGKPIPDVPNPQYPTDPDDPAKVTPDEPVPDIPGMIPEQPTVTPTDPGKDTPVVYNPVDDTQKASVRYIDLDDNDKELANSGILEGKPGERIDYSTKKTIDALTDKGYVLVNDGFPADAAFDNDKDHDQVFIVSFKHGRQPVNPQDPGKPGEPINPNDPNGPKYPEGSDQVTKDVTRTVHYEGAGDNTPKDVEQKVNFTAEGVLDKVTGQWITPLKWSENQDVSGVKTPVVDGYHVVNVDRDADGNNVKGVTLTHDDDNYTVNVKYEPNGKIIPVDPSGKPIPNVPQPQYPTDPKDPAKVTPDEPVPEIPGYKPEVPTVTPTDPGEDTPVKYVPVTPAKDKGSITVNVYDTTDKTDLPEYGKKSGEEEVGTKFNYDKPATITTLENKGYEVLNPEVVIPTEITKGNQNITILVKHKNKTVTPDKPGEPGQPVDPGNPNGPKYPEGTDLNNLKKTGTQTIHYEGAGDKTPSDNKQSFDFTKKITFDEVTGKIIEDSGWNVDSHTFGKVDTPVVDGYHADKRTAGGETVTPEDLNKVVTVTYTPNGKIVPVDPSGKPIPNVPTPQYPTDPTDPTKVTPDEPVPNIPGMTPETPTVTPKDPGKDTEVVYHVPDTDKGTVNVYVHDNTTGKNLDNYGWSTGKEPVDVGTKVDFDKPATITDLTDKGYKVINPDVEIPAEVTKGTTNVTIYVEHTTTIVTPDKPGAPGEPVDPGNPNGPKYPEGTDLNNLKKTGTQTIHYEGAGDKTPQDNKQSFDFTKKITFDNVTGKIIDNGEWNVTSHTFGKENTPVVDGYHADKRTAGGETVTPEDLNKTVTVTYTPNGKIVPVDPSGKPIPNVPTPQYPTDPTDPTKVTPDEPVPNVPGMTPDTPTVTPKNPGEDTTVIYHTDSEVKTSQTVNFVDDQGKQLRKPNVQNGFSFQTKDGKSTVESHTYNDVDVPVIDGYVADKSNITVDSNGAYVPGQKVTVDKPNVTINVIYHKVGKIVPVGPDNQPIPDAPTPEYKNDPTDPTKVTPNEDIPAVPGYEPKNPGQKVTPENPTKDTEVPYTQIVGDGRIVINYVDQDDNNAVLHSDTPAGKFGTKITYTTADEIKKLTDQGYELVSDGFTDGKDHAEFTKENNNHVYEVIMKHGTATVTPDKPGNPGQPINPNDPDGPKWPDNTGKDGLEVVGHQTIHYTGAGNSTPQDIKEETTFTRKLVVDKVTGKIIKDDGWNQTSHTFDVHKTPVVNGYVANVKEAGGFKATPDDPDKTYTVDYKEIGKIVPVDKDGNPIPGAPTPIYKNDPTDPTKVLPNEPVPTVDGWKPVVPNVTPQDPTKDTPVVYTKNETPVVPAGPDTPTPNKPDEPAPTPDEPTPAPEPESPIMPKGEEMPSEPEEEPETAPVHGQDEPKTVKPKANVMPHGQKVVAPQSEAVNPTAPAKTLPQTGDSDNTAAVIAGAAAASMSLIGLAGVKKRRKD